MAGRRYDARGRPILGNYRGGTVVCPDTYQQAGVAAALAAPTKPPKRARDDSLLADHLLAIGAAFRELLTVASRDLE